MLTNEAARANGGVDRRRNRDVTSVLRRSNGQRNCGSLAAKWHKPSPLSAAMQG
jgi:hypothetical protein